jgi:hypothetical protein
VCNPTHSKSAIAKIASELNTIHSNMQYWTCGAPGSSEEKAAYSTQAGRRGKKSLPRLHNPFWASPHSIEIHTTKNKGEGT